MQITQNGSLLHADKTSLDSLFGNRNERDKEERSNIATALGNGIKNRTDKDLIDLQHVMTPRVAGTTFDNAQEFARVELLKFTETPAFLALLAKLALSRNVLVCVDEKARLSVRDKDAWLEVAPQALGASDAQEDLAMLAECTAHTGGYVYSGDFIGVEQWLRFHHYTIPGTVSEVQNLIAYLAFKMPASPVTGDYHQLLREPVESPFHLSVAERQIIKQVIGEFTQGRGSLLQYIATTNFDKIAEHIRRQRAAYYLANFLITPNANTLGEVLHERLEWHLDASDPEVAKRQIKCLVATALIVDLGIEVEPHAKVIAGYELYQPANASRTASQVVEALETHLIVETLLEPHFAPLAAHLLLAGAAPPFLVQQIPAELTLGKPEWVILAQAVALIELAAPGASRRMNYNEVKAFADISPVSPQQRALHDLTAITPIIDWAMLNGILPPSTDTDYDVDTFTKAATCFSQYVEALNEVETGISAIPPDRRKIALKALQRALPAGDYLEQRAFKIKFDPSLGERNFLEWLTLYHPVSLGNVTGENSKIAKLRASLLDLYMSGDLVVNGQLTDNFITTGNFSPPAGALSRLGELESVDPLFDKAFEQYHRTLQKSLASIIKMAVSNLPERDRTMLANGTITLYTVRKTVNPLNPVEETQRQRNAAKGRYGILLGCQQGKAFRCYELFTLRGLCRERPQLADKLRSSGVVYDTPALSYAGKDTDFLPKNPERQWPLDFAAYQDGSEPKQSATSSVVVEKLWHFSLVSDEVQPVPLFFSRAFDALAEAVLGNHPVATREELYSSLYAQTELQKIRAENDTVNEAIINVIVPFKKCIEDIRSGDAPRVSEGIGGCILDSLALLGLVVGFGATVAGIVGKTASTTAKALSIAKAGAHFSVSLFNPFDGLPTLALQGTRLAKRGVLLLSKHGIAAVETATGQLRKLTGSTQSYDLIKAAQKSDLLQGSWKSAGDLGDPVNLVALERNSDWYALNLRVAGPWGARLKNLKVAAFSPLRRLFGTAKPFGYTRSFVKRAVPAAKTKLDNALALLSDTQNSDLRSVLKHVFGNDSDEILKHVAANLKSMRNDLDHVTLANMSFRKGSDNYAALRPAAYKRWKESVQTGTHLKQPAERFLVIYPEGLDDYYRMAKYDDTRVGDALVHEMAHGAPDTLDLYYGRIRETGTGPADFDVGGLIEFARDAHKAHPKNLANPHFSVAHAPGFDEFQARAGSLPELVRNHPALLNADSYSLAVSLLDQARTHREAFLHNLARIQNALRNTGPGHFIKGSVRINLAKAGL